MKWLKRWYEGEYKGPDNEPGSSLVFIIGRYERHWTSRLAHVAVGFYLSEWKWIITTSMGCAALWFAYLKIR
jgi:hypothetical protein